MSDPGSRLFNLAELKQNGFKAGNLLAVDPNLHDKFMTHLSRTVRRDEITKNIIFLTGVSAYTKNPTNVFMRGPSSIGKSYNTIQVLKYFPIEDVWMLGGLSPTALVHDKGVLFDRNGNEIDFYTDKPSKQKVKEQLLEFYRDIKDKKVDKAMVDAAFEEARKEWTERLRDARYIVDLRGKILVFLEPPHIETYNKLRPILSHDKEEISYKFTDKEAQGKLRTAHVVIKGWPATIFCSTEERYIEDLATRGFTITPEMGPEKYQAGIQVVGEKKALPWKFHQDFDFMLLQGYFAWLKTTLQSLNVVVPYARELAQCYPHTYPRSMRDYDHFTALIEINALFHYAQRPILVVERERPVASDKEEGETVTETEDTVLATMADLEYVLGLWKKAEETTVTGLPGHILEFFYAAAEPLAKEIESFGYQELTRKYNEVSEQKKSSWAIRKWVKLLSDIGWLDTEPDPTDKRKNIVKVIKKAENACDSWTQIFLDSFTLESFKTWLEDAKKILEKNSVLLKENLLANEPTSLEDIHEKFYLHKKDFVSNIFSGPSKPETESKSETLDGNISFQQSQTISETLTVQETLIALKSTWQKGPYSEFDGLIMKTRGCSREEAERLREKWLDEGLIGYDPEGWLVWTK